MFYVVNFSQFWCEVDHFFPILARGLFQKLVEKALTQVSLHIHAGLPVASQHAHLKIWKKAKHSAPEYI